MGRLEGATELLEKCVRSNPSFLPARLYLVSCYGLLGRDEEGRKQVAAILDINPDYRASRSGGRRIRDREMAGRFTESLRRLGLP